MTEPPPDVTEFYSLGDAQAIVQRFELLLRRNGIGVEPESPLEQAILDTFRCVYEHTDGSDLQVGRDVRKQLRNLMGLSEFARLVLQVEKHQSFPALVEHLRLFNEGQALQNTKSPQQDAAANKLFELFIGVLALKAGTDVELDDPNRSTGDNPDVVATIRGRRWSFACKAIHSTHPEALISNIRKGFEQIDRAPVDLGIVTLNFKNVIHHETYWPVLNEAEWRSGAEAVLGAFGRPELPFEALKRECQEVSVVLKEYLTDDVLADVFASTKGLPGYLYWANTVAGTVIDELPVPTTLKFMGLTHLRPFARPELDVLGAVHDAAFT